MIKEIVVGVISAVLTAVVFFIAGAIGRIPTFLSVPDGAVIAFNAKSCPAGSWREYELARGRFVRGIDNSHSGIDPDQQGTARMPGNIQDQEVVGHFHTRPGDVFDTGNGKSGVLMGKGVGHGVGNPPSTGTFGGDETRPKNVALLYCEKF